MYCCGSGTINCLEVKQEKGYSFTITKKVAAGSGLGSSASSSAAAVVALNELLGSPFLATISFPLR